MRWTTLDELAEAQAGMPVMLAVGDIIEGKGSLSMSYQLGIWWWDDTFGAVCLHSPVEYVFIGSLVS